MQYTTTYQSPLGGILLAADGLGLTGLWFEGQKYFALYLDKEHQEKELPVLIEAKRWLDIYFSGHEPNFKLPLHFKAAVNWVLKPLAVEQSIVCLLTKAVTHITL